MTNRPQKSLYCVVFPRESLIYRTAAVAVGAAERASGSSFFRCRSSCTPRDSETKAGRQETNASSGYRASRSSVTAAVVVELHNSGVVVVQLVLTRTGKLGYRIPVVLPLHKRSLYRIYYLYGILGSSVSL